MSFFDFLQNLANNPTATAANQNPSGIPTNLTAGAPPAGLNNLTAFANPNQVSYLSSPNVGSRGAGIDTPITGGGNPSAGGNTNVAGGGGLNNMAQKIMQNPAALGMNLMGQNSQNMAQQTQNLMAHAQPLPAGNVTNSQQVLNSLMQQQQLKGLLQQ